MTQQLTEQRQTVHAEAEEQQQNIILTSCLHPEPVSIPPQSNADGAEKLLGLLEGLVVLQRDRKRVDGEGPAAPLQAAQLEKYGKLVIKNKTKIKKCVFSKVVWYHLHEATAGFATLHKR